MAIFTKYTQAKLKFLKAVFSYVMPYEQYEAYSHALPDFTFKHNLYKYNIPDVLQNIISEYAHEEFKAEEVQAKYNLREKKFLECAELVYDNSLSAMASALLWKGFDSIEFSQYAFNIDPNNHCHVIKHLGVNSIMFLDYMGADFEALQPGNIRIIVSELGIAAIKSLYEVGAKFENLSSNDLFYLVASNPGIDSIKPLSEAGAKFSDMDLKTKNLVVKTLGVVTMEALAEVGVEFGDSSTDRPDKLNDASMPVEHSPELAPE